MPLNGHFICSNFQNLQHVALSPLTFPLTLIIMHSFCLILPLIFNFNAVNYPIRSVVYASPDFKPFDGLVPLQFILNVITITHIFV